MRFEFIVALRYLKAKRKQAVVSLITGISVVGVAAGVAALVIALAMNSGFRQDLQAKLLGAQPHISLLTRDGSGIDNYMEVVDRVRQVEGVTGAAPAIYQEVLLHNGFRPSGARIKGIIPELESKRSTLLDSLVDGQAEDFGEDSILLGEELSHEMGSFVGDQVRVQSIETTVSPLGAIPKTFVLDVTGIYRTGLYEFDAIYVLAPMWVVQRLSARGDVASHIEVQIEDPDRSDQLGPRIVEAAGGNVEFVDWKTQNQALFQMFKLERLAMFLAIGLIVIVASLNIVVSLVMMVMEKTRDIAVLMSMGATRDNIRRVFLAQGVIIGVVGTVLGLAIGNSVAWITDKYRLIALSEQTYAIDHVPFALSWSDSAIIAAAAILISYLATLYPSRAASALEPVEALRYE